MPADAAAADAAAADAGRCRRPADAAAADVVPRARFSFFARSHVVSVVSRW
jgi:hypothetical protein